MQPGGGEAVDPGEAGCEAPKQAQAGAGSLGLRAELHYVAAVHPEENQRLLMPMGWVGHPRQEVEGHSWSARERKRIIVEKQCYIKFYL